MKPRRPRQTRRTRRRWLLETAQLLALRDVAGGRREPGSPREDLYLQLHNAGRNPDPADFILPAPLAELELLARQIAERTEADAG